MMMIMNTFIMHLFSANDRIRRITQAIQQNRMNLEEELERRRAKSKADRSRRWRLFNRLMRTSTRHMRKRRAYIFLQAQKAEKTQWILDRPQGKVFWGNVVQNYTDREWKEHFRMTRSTFDFVLQLVEKRLTKKTTRWRKCIEPRLRLAVVLWWYATPGDYRTISTLFGIGRSTLCYLVRQVTAALKQTLLARFICLPKGERLQETIAGFLKHGYPQCAGAIDGTHIPVVGPKDDPASSHNRKDRHSIVLQAVVDHKYCFTDVYLGWPGRTHDARVLVDSTLYRTAEEDQNGFLFPRETSRMVNGVEVAVHLIGDPAYPLKNWLMKAFTHRDVLTEDQKKFNFHLSSARMVVENAFGRLKGRWRCLIKHNGIDVVLMPDIVTVCCILHNVCELQKDTFLPEWYMREEEVGQQLDDVSKDEFLREPRDMREAIMTLL